MDKLYYNGYLFPEIPTGLLETHPYCWIRKNDNTEHFDLLFTQTIGYYDAEVGGIVYGENAATTEVEHYRLAFADEKTAEDWESYQVHDTWLALDENRTIVWANHNIPEGSLTAPDVYFVGSSPIPDMEYYRIQKSTLVGIADEVRRLCLTEETMTPARMEERLSRLTLGGGSSGSGGSWGDGDWGGSGASVKGYVERTDTTYIDSATTFIADNAFLEHPDLVTVRFPSVETIGNSAFSGCTRLETADFPSATTVGYDAFYGCVSLKYLNMPNLQDPGDSDSGGYAFGDCSSLETVNMPSLMSIPEDMFSYCTALTEASFSAATSVGDYAMSGCTSLVKVTLGSAMTIGEYAFEDCSSLTELHLGNESVVCTITDSTFEGSPIGPEGSGGTVYVPTSLLTEYEADAEWSKLISDGTCTLVGV